MDTSQEFLERIREALKTKKFTLSRKQPEDEIHLHSGQKIPDVEEAIKGVEHPEYHHVVSREGRREQRIVVRLISKKAGATEEPLAGLLRDVRIAERRRRI